MTRLLAFLLGGLVTIVPVLIVTTWQEIDLNNELLAAQPIGSYDGPFLDGKPATVFYGLLGEDDKEFIHAVLQVRQSLLTPYVAPSEDEEKKHHSEMLRFGEVCELLSQDSLLQIDKVFDVKQWQELRSKFYDLAKYEWSESFKPLRVICEKKIKQIDQYLGFYEAGVKH